MRKLYTAIMMMLLMMLARTAEAAQEPTRKPKPRLVSKDPAIKIVSQPTFVPAPEATLLETPAAQATEVEAVANATVEVVANTTVEVVANTTEVSVADTAEVDVKAVVNHNPENVETPKQESSFFKSATWFVFKVANDVTGLFSRQESAPTPVIDQDQTIFGDYLPVVTVVAPTVKANVTLVDPAAEISRLVANNTCVASDEQVAANVIVEATDVTESECLTFSFANYGLCKWSVKPSVKSAEPRSFETAPEVVSVASMVAAEPAVEARPVAAAVVSNKTPVNRNIGIRLRTRF